MSNDFNNLPPGQKSRVRGLGHIWRRSGALNATELEELLGAGLKSVAPQLQWLLEDDLDQGMGR